MLAGVVGLGARQRLQSYPADETGSSPAKRTPPASLVSV
jgi:hypothetical protein